MTEEDKELIGRYMNWEIDQGVWRLAPNGDIDTADFDLNDAGLCVQEMQKRGDLWSYTKFACNFFCRKCVKTLFTYEFVACFFNPENFFGAMAAWIKEGKK